MSFIENIKSCIWNGEEPPSLSYRAVLFGDGAIYLEGVKHIASYTKEEIVVCLKKGALRVEGAELYIKKFFAGDMVICGRIYRIENRLGI